jgi:hypothetical protein
MAGCGVSMNPDGITQVAALGRTLNPHHATTRNMATGILNMP